MSTLQKARIYDPDHVENGFYVQFNPNALSYSVGTNGKSASVNTNQNAAAQNSPKQGDPTGVTGLATLSTTLFFHTYRNEVSYTDVRQDVHRIRAFLRRSNDGNGVISRKIAFSWGTLTVVGTLESISVSYQMFAADGTPVQAEVTISIQGEDPDVTADGNNRAAEIEIKKNAVSAWRDQKKVPELLSWLFDE